MTIAITCLKCGFLYEFVDEDIHYAGPVCPDYRTAAPRVEVEIDQHPASAARLGGPATPATGWMNVRVAPWRRVAHPTILAVDVGAPDPSPRGRL